MKKGQAAMEFLMTYGWAILVVIAAIGALAYFGVLNPQNWMPEICTGSAGMDCLEKASITSSNGVIRFAIKNGLTRDINITTAAGSADCATISQFNITPSGESMIAITGGRMATLDSEQQAIVAVKCSGGLKAGKVSSQIKLTYKTLDTKLDHSVVYSIKGRAA